MTKRLTFEELTSRFSGNFAPHVRLLGSRVVERKGNKNTVGIVSCSIHGEQNASLKFLQDTKVGCPLCGKAARGSHARVDATSGIGRIYIVAVKAFGAEAIKVGFTKNSVHSRYSHEVTEIILDEQLAAWDAILIEAMVHRSQTLLGFRDESIRAAAVANGTSWDGWAECYRIDAKEKIFTFVKSIIDACEIRDFW